MYINQLLRTTYTHSPYQVQDTGYWQLPLSVIRMRGRGGRVGIKQCLRGADTDISNLIFVQNTELQTDEKEQGDGYHSICKRY